MANRLRDATSPYLLQHAVYSNRIVGYSIDSRVTASRRWDRLRSGTAETWPGPGRRASLSIIQRHAGL